MMNWKPILGLVLIAVGLLLFPIVITGAEAIRTHESVGQYSGLSNFVQIVPLLAMVGLIGSGGFLTWTGIRERRKSKSAKAGRKGAY